jgi:hypothetical protein
MTRAAGAVIDGAMRTIVSPSMATSARYHGLAGAVDDPAAANDEVVAIGTTRLAASHGLAESASIATSIDRNVPVAMPAVRTATKNATAHSAIISTGSAPTGGSSAASSSDARRRARRATSMAAGAMTR